MDLLVIFGKTIPSDEYNGNNPEYQGASTTWQAAATDAELSDAAKRPNSPGPSK